MANIVSQSIKQEYLSYFIPKTGKIIMQSKNSIGLSQFRGRRLVFDALILHRDKNYIRFIEI